MTLAPEIQERITSEIYRDNYQHLADELHKLDLLLKLKVDSFRSRTSTTAGLAADPKVYISHAEIDRLLSLGDIQVTGTTEGTALYQQLEKLQSEIDERVQISKEQDIFMALPQLAKLFRLSSIEIQAVMICLAPELRRKYDRIYAYLQDDITRKKPSIDLVLDLLCENESERWETRSLFTAEAPLRWSGILRTSEDPLSPSGSSGLAQFLSLDPRVLNFILGNNVPDVRLNGLITLIDPRSGVTRSLVDSTIKIDLLNLIKHAFDTPRITSQKVVLHLHGPRGIGKRDLALEICSDLGCPLLCVDVAVLLARVGDVEGTLRLAYREGLLLQSAIYLENADGLLGEETEAPARLRELDHIVTEYGWLTFLGGEMRWSPNGIFSESVVQSVDIPIPNMPQREKIWQAVLDGWMSDTESSWAGTLAERFSLTQGQIQEAAALAGNWHAMKDGQGQLTITELFAACRAQTNQKLSELAVKIEPVYGWEDIVLPEEKILQLKEICNQVSHRHQVMDEWGFERKLSYAKGLSALFSGPPGTGKTMAAEVIAGELGLDLYKIDLSGVVSKYVGETEKNLARIFQEAETSNAVLFFDEADALFGKRTRISDAHDRYANIETSYLLQRMETYQGIVILATNLRENLDDAFTRRIRFIVEFPFPDVARREEIWRRHFPHEAPLGGDVNIPWLARQFAIAGGDIRNIVLNAAFLASADGGTIEMAHILRGARREYDKLGKLWNGQGSPATSEKRKRNV